MDVCEMYIKEKKNIDFKVNKVQDFDILPIDNKDRWRSLSSNNYSSYISYESVENSVYLPCFNGSTSDVRKTCILYASHVKLWPIILWSRRHPLGLNVLICVSDRFCPLKFVRELETLNNFCPSRFSEVCPDFIFFKIQICTVSVSRFSRPVQICVTGGKI